mgnify:CR=1 FL=1
MSTAETATSPNPAKKPQSIWNNHPFHFHIAAYLIPLVFAVLLAFWLYVRHVLQKIANAAPADALQAVADSQANITWAAFLLMAGATVLIWIVARRIATQLDILKRQAAVIRVFDFKTDIPLDTPIREIFGLGRAMRQMKDTIQKFMRVTIALSGERDFGKLLGRIIHEMRESLDGDGGVIYLYDDKTNVFKETSQRWVKGARPQPNAVADISLDDAAHPVAQAVANAHATTVHTIGLPRPKGLEYLSDRYGNESVFLVAVPLRASDNSLVGIVCNFLAPGKPHPSAERTALAEAFSSVAAVAIDQQRLLEAQKALLDSMIKLLAGAIDAKSPYTGGHAERVPELGIMLAEEACKVTEGPLADFSFKTEEEWREFRIGAWLHDCGKVTTPEYVVDKSCKLETIYNRIHEIRMRFEVLLRDGSRRSYSMAGAPHVAEQIELHIRHMPGGKFTDALFGATQPGFKERDILRFEGPMGTFFLREDSDVPIVFVASGTGFAPIKAIIEHMEHQGITRPTVLYWGCRSKADLYLNDWVEQAAARLPWLRYVPVLSEAKPEDLWSGRTGFVHQAVMADFPDLSGHEVYACGVPVMVDAAQRDFTGQCGLPAEAFYCDSFTTKADKAA